MIWKFIKADNFFPKYCPQVKNYKHKIRGLSGRDKPLDFTDEEKKQIREGLKHLLKDLLKKLY